MAHAQKPDLVFWRNRWVHLNWRGRQFSRLLAAEVCASAVVRLDTPCSEVAWEYWLPIPFTSFPLTSPPVRHRVPSGFNWILTCQLNEMWLEPQLTAPSQTAGKSAKTNQSRYLLWTLASTWVLCRWSQNCHAYPPTIPREAIHARAYCSVDNG
jgi:hypothetical protein